MKQEHIFTDKAPTISITECNGDLVIRSWPDSSIMIKSDDYEVNEAEGQFSLSSKSDMKVMVPEGSQLAVTYVNGDLVIKNVQGDVTLQEVNGDAVLVGTGNLKVSTVNGDMSAKNLQADIHVAQISGDAVFRSVNSVALDHIDGDVSARFVNGDFTLDKSSGDVSLHTVNGRVTISYCQRDVSLNNLGSTNRVEGVQGDIRLRGSLSNGDHYFAAERDIILRWPNTAPIDLVAEAPKIGNRLSLDKVVEEEGKLIGRIGDGQTTVQLKANGRIILKEMELIDEKWSFDGADVDFEFNMGLEDLGEEISRQVSEHVSRFSNQFEQKFGPDFATRLTEKVVRKAEQAAAKAEKAAERARRQAERQAERQAYRGGRVYGRPPTPPSPAQPKPKASPEEQLKILRMVEQGIISPEEATTLLDALE